MPLYSFAEHKDNNARRDGFQGTYAYENSQDCLRPDNRLDIGSVGVFTLDGRGNYVSHGDEVFIQKFPGLILMGQSDSFCSGAYFIERVNGAFVIKFPEQLCVGKTTVGSPGAAPEPEPREFFNYSLIRGDGLLMFQQHRRRIAGIISGNTPVDVPVGTETINFPDIGLSIEQRCRLIGTFLRTGRFTVLNPPVPAESGEPPP